MADAKLSVDIVGKDSLSKELKSIESNVIRFVGAISSALTALTAIGFPIVSAANFQKELLSAAKTTQYTRDEIDQLRAGLSDLSKQTNVTAVDLAKIATMGGQIGIGGDGNVDALVSFTKSIATAVSSLDISAEEAVESMGKLINIFNIAPQEFDRVVSSLTAVSVASTANAQKLFDVVRRIGNLGGSVTLPQAAALSGSLIDLGLTAETAGTTITKIFADMKSNAAGFATVALKGNIEAGKSIDDLRFTTEEWINLVATDGIKALQAYVTGLNNMGETQAAQTKSMLTGEGRLFEAVTKLQQQQKRQTGIQQAIAASEATILRMKQRGSEATEEQIAAEVARHAALKNAAIQANVVNRLEQKAAEAFASGAEGAKAQETVLTGLIAQWEVFLNTAVAAANAIGTVALPPLTDLLRRMSEGLKASGAEEELKQATKDIVEAVRSIGAAFEYLRTFIGTGGGFDWGALFKAGAILAAVAAIKSVVGLLKVLGASAANAIPGVMSLTNALFGVQKAADSAAKAASTREGGLFSSIASGAVRAATNVAVLSKNLTTLKPEVATRLSDAQSNLVRAQQALAASYSQIALRAKSVADAERMVADYRNRLATATGRSVGGIVSQIRYMEGLLQNYYANTEAVGRFRREVDVLNRTLLRINRGIGAISFPFATQIKDIVAPMQKAGAQAVQAFMSGWNSGGAKGILAAMASSLSTALSSAFSRQSAGNLWAGLTAGLGAVTQGVGNLIARLAGLEVAWLAASTGATKFFTITVAGFLLLGKAIGYAVRALGVIANLAFVALMLYEVLKAIGVWERLVVLVQRFAGAMGIAKESLPSFLQTSKDAEAATQKVEKFADAYKRLREEAAKFNDERKGTLAVAQQDNLAAKDLSFSFKEPGAASKNAVGYLQAMSSAYAEIVVKLQGYKSATDSLAVSEKNAADKQKAYEEALKNTTKLTQDVERAQRKLDASMAGGLNVLSDRAAAEAELAAAKSRLDRANIATVSPLKRAADEANADVEKIKTAIRGFTSAIAGAGGTIAEPFKGVDKAMTNFVSTVFTADEAVKLFGKQGDDAIPLMRKYGDAVAQQTRLIDELAAANKKLEETKPAAEGTFSVADRLRDEGAAQEATQALDEQRKKVAALKEEILKVGRSRNQINELLDTMGESKSPSNLLQIINGMVDAARQLKAEDFKGLSLPQVNANDMLSQAAVFVVKTRAKEMYTAFSKYAQEEAERAKNYVNQARGEMEKALRSAAAFAEKISQTQSANSNKAKNQLLDREDEARSRQYLQTVKTQQDVERALLEQTFSIQQRNLIEQEQGGYNVFTQKVEMYAFEQQALFELEERYRKITDLESDRLNLQKQRRAATDEVAQFDKLIKKVEYYKKLVTEANNIINNPRGKSEDQYAALVRRNDALDKMRGIYSQLESSTERLAAMEPIGGELVANPADLERMTKSITDVAGTIGRLNLEGAGSIERTMNAAAQSAAAMAKGFETEADIARTSFIKMAGAADKANGSVAEIANNMAKLVAQSPALASGLESLQKVLQQGLASPGAIDTAGLTAITDQIVSAVSKVQDTKIPLTLDKAALADQIAGALLEGTSDAAKRVAISPTAIPVQPTVGVEGMTRLQQDIAAQQAAGGKVFVDVQLKATDIDLSQIEGKLNVSLKVNNNARGGLIGSVVSLGEGLLGNLPRFALGGSSGKVRGPGTGTSDSVLSWLSNGEYVIDALTTSRFGSKFFAVLQRMARGGKSAAFMRSLSIPSFAVGGPSPLPAIGPMDSFETDFKNERTKRDVVDINISDGKRTATIQAEREQARSLIGILRKFEG